MFTSRTIPLCNGHICLVTFQRDPIRPSKRFATEGAASFSEVPPLVPPKQDRSVEFSFFESNFLFTLVEGTRLRPAAVECIPRPSKSQNI